MIIAPPYISDRDVYSLLPLADRWIMNKLIVGETFGYDCGPTGMRVPAGDYCVRPMMNLFGLGEGGFFKVTQAPGPPQGRMMQSLPGYFWQEWYTGIHNTTQYIDDVPVIHGEFSIDGSNVQSTNLRRANAGAAVTAPAMPTELQGISKYMMIERIGSNIIDVSPRLALMHADQFVIDHHKGIDPSYNPQPGTDIEMGQADVARLDLTWDTGEQTLTGWRWGRKGTNRRPF